MAILDADDFFGEMTLITGNKRSASAIAQTDCKLHTMDKETFEYNLSNDIKFTKKILETLAHRLEETDTNLKRHIQRISRLTQSLQCNRIGGIRGTAATKFGGAHVLSQVKCLPA